MCRVMFSKHVCLLLCYGFYKHTKLYVLDSVVYMLCNKSILIFGLNLGLNLKRLKKKIKMSSIIFMHPVIKKNVLKANIRLKGFVWRYIYSFQFGKFSKIYILCVSNCVQIKHKISTGIVSFKIPALLI